MKKEIKALLLSSIVICLLFTLATCAVCFAETKESGQTVQMLPTPTATLSQVVGKTNVTLQPTLYPNFYDYSSDNPACGEYFKTPYSRGGLSLAPLWTVSKYSGNNYRAIPSNPGLTSIPDLVIKDFSIQAAFKNTTKLLITWTVRVEGYKPDIGTYTIWPNLCNYWHGISYQGFPGGQVLTQLYINGEAYGNTVALTIPDGGISITSQPNDPTITGSFVLTKDDFANKSFPAKMTIEIRWSNITPLKVISPANMRNLIITALPITTQQ